jgi:hypothetical protein
MHSAKLTAGPAGLITGTHHSPGGQSWAGHEPSRCQAVLNSRLHHVDSACSDHGACWLLERGDAEQRKEAEKVLDVTKKWM